MQLGSRSVPALAGGLSEGGASSANHAGSSADVFATVNRVAAVADSEYVKLRSGSSRRRSVERRRSGDRRRAEARHQLPASGGGALFQPTYLAQLRQHAQGQRARQLRQAAVMAAQLLGESQAAAEAAAAAQAGVPGGNVAAWLATSAAAPATGPDTAGQQPPSPPCHRRSSAEALAAANPAAFWPPAPPAPLSPPAAGEPWPQLPQLPLVEPALQLHDSADSYSSPAPPAARRMGPSCTAAGAAPAACPSKQKHGECGGGASKEGKAREACWHRFNPVAALSRLLRF